MFWGIDRPEWIQLWDGVFGAFVAAVVGGLVALFVVRLTNRHQSRLAVEAREKAAIADLLASSNRFITEYSQGYKAIEHLVPPMEAAAVRWRMELDDERLADELSKWPHHLAGLAWTLCNIEESHGVNGKAYSDLSTAIDQLRTTGMMWHKLDKNSKERQVVELIRARTSEH